MKMWSVRLHTGDDGLVTVAAQSAAGGEAVLTVSVAREVPAP